MPLASLRISQKKWTLTSMMELPKGEGKTTCKAMLWDMALCFSCLGNEKMLLSEEKV